MRRADPPCFDQLYRDHRDRIYRFCCRLCRSESDAEELAQEVFLLAFRGLDRFEGRSSVATWLYRIALHRWHRIDASRPPLTEALDEESLPGASPDPAAGVACRVDLERALARLPVAQREAFLLVHAEGLKFREAAAVLGVPQGTVHTRVHEAIVRLRRLLGGSAADTDAAAKSAPARKEGGP